MYVHIHAYKFIGKSVSLSAAMRGGGKIGLYSKDIITSSMKDSV